ncbi:MAG TPA: hypothetical protein PLQ71_19880 [Nitrospira sp.]|nr:hypothetical protein [Nitrospira sp.]
MEQTNSPVLVEEVADSDPIDRFVDEILGELEPVEAKPEPEEVEPETVEEEPVESEPEYLEIKHNGKPVKLSLDEVIEHAQKGFDYTAKTQEIAEQRKQVEAYAQHVQQQAVFQQQFQQDFAAITAMDMQIQRYKDVDWGQYTDSDPVEATKAWQRYQILQGQRNEKAQELSQRQAQLREMEAQRQQQSLAEAAQQLERELGKAWNAETRAALKTTGKGYGFSDEELGAISDPRVVKVLLDAYKWQNLQSTKPAVQKKVSEAPKLAKPGTQPQADNSQRKQLSKILKSSTVRGRREAAAMALLDDFVR